MPVTVNWLDEAQTILLITGQKFTSAELSAAKPEISQLQQSVPHPIGIIQDMRNLSLIEDSRPGPLPGMSQPGGSFLKPPASPSDARVAALAFVYRADMVEYMNQMFSLAAKLLPGDSKITGRAFSSTEAAAEFITGVLKQSR